MIMALPTMFRATQNRNEPNLSFAQSLSPTMFRDNQNPNEPNLPFSQSPRGQQTYRVSITGNGLFGTKDTETNLTEGGIGYWRGLGYTVTILDSSPTPTPTTPTPTPTPTPTGSGLSRSEVENIIESYHGDDIALLHSHAVNFGKTISSAKLHRDSIEGKVELGNTQRAEIHTKLSDLGRSVSDVSSALSAHSSHELIPNPLGDILPYVLIGGVALLAMRK